MPTGTEFDRALGRKGLGAYYTPAALARHLVHRSAGRAFAVHLERVGRLAARDPVAAARALHDFAVVDPACGGGGFLVAVLDELATLAGRFLRTAPLPGLPGEDGPLRRLLLEACVFGVDVSAAGAQAAVDALLLAAGSPLGVEPNVLVGNALLGRAEPGGPPGPALARGRAGGDGRARARGDAASVGAPPAVHWPLAFPGVFARERPGFDAVVGNPPWEEVTVEALGFLALAAPGLRGLAEPERTAAVERLLADRPELAARLRDEQARAAWQRRSLAAGAGGARMPGDPDLYKFFCRRYRELLRDGGALGVVLPRGALAASGSAEFRGWLFQEMTCERVDFLQNRRGWVFPTHPQYTIALVTAVRTPPAAGHRVRVAGTAAAPGEWARQAASAGAALAAGSFGPGWTVPLLRDRAEAALLARLRRGSPFAFGAGGRWRCFPVAELHETADRRLWQGATHGLPLWKGGSFDRYDPHGAGARACPDGPELAARLRKARPGARSMVAAELGLDARRAAAAAELGRARVAFRDVTNRTNSRTVLACLVPPGVLLTNKAPYLAFARGGARERAACLGIMNSLPFDWQARRFVEINLNFFALEGLVVPDLDDVDLDEVARAAARLSCVDARYTAVAGELGVAVGPLGPDERARLCVEVDARVARAWGLDARDLDVLLADFTPTAVPPAYRARLRERLGQLQAGRPFPAIAAYY